MEGEQPNSSGSKKHNTGNRRKDQPALNFFSNKNTQIPDIQRYESEEALRYMFEYRMNDCFCAKMPGKPHQHRRPLKIVNERFNYSSRRCSTRPGSCADGNECVYSHGPQEELYHPMRYKTSRCNYRSWKGCPRGDDCAHAHSAMEQRDLRAIFGVNFRSYNEPIGIELAAQQQQEADARRREADRRPRREEDDRRNRDREQEGNAEERERRTGNERRRRARDDEADRRREEARDRRRREEKNARTQGSQRDADIQKNQAKMIRNLRVDNKELMRDLALLKERLAKKDEEMEQLRVRFEETRLKEGKALSASRALADRLVLAQKQHAEKCPMLKAGFDDTAQYVTISEVEEIFEENDQLSGERDALKEEMKGKDELIEKMRVEIQAWSRQQEEQGSLGRSETEFVAWFCSNFAVKPGNVWEDLQMKCVANGLDCVSFWMDVVMREPERNPEFSMEHVFRTVLGFDKRQGMRPVISGMTTKIKQGVSVWLKNVPKLRGYDGFFEDLGFMNVSDLLGEDVDDAMLKEAGIGKAGHRVRILFYLSELGKKQEPGGGREGFDRIPSARRTRGNMC